MNITRQTQDDRLIIFLEGKLDTVTAPQLDAELRAAFEDRSVVEVDMEKLAYISSAGLRVLHSTHKRLKSTGKRLLISHASGMVLDVFESTGFASFLELI